MAQLTRRDLIKQGLRWLQVPRHDTRFWPLQTRRRAMSLEQ